MDVVSGLFQAAEPGSAVRLGCLSNRSLGHEIFRSFPVGLFGGGAHMVEWLSRAPDDELFALFENPALSDSFLRDLLERVRRWESIDDEKFCRVVSILHTNPRMRTPRNDDWMDGYDEFNYASVFDAAWKLAEVVPTTEAWAFALGWLYERLLPDAFSIKDPLSIAERWRVDPSDAEASKQQAKDRELGDLSNKERVRKGLARLALRKNGKLLAELLASEDLALRAAAYSAGDLSPAELRAGYEKDGEIAFTEAIGNMALWRRQSTRLALREIAWAVVNADKHSDLLAANVFTSKEKDLRREHPAWFADEEGGGESNSDGADGQAPAKMADLAEFSAHMDRQSQALGAISQSLRGLMSRASWIWWFSLGALVASLWHF